MRLIVACRLTVIIFILSKIRTHLRWVDVDRKHLIHYLIFHIHTIKNCIDVTFHWIVEESEKQMLSACHLALAHLCLKCSELQQALKLGTHRVGVACVSLITIIFLIYYINQFSLNVVAQVAHRHREVGKQLASLTFSYRKHSEKQMLGHKHIAVKPFGFTPRSLHKLVESI